MARYIFHTNLGVDECRKRFEASVDRGLPWKREYHPYWEFVGNVRGNRFQLQRRLSFESGRRQHGLGFQRDTRRMFFGSFVEQQNGIMINLEFRHPRHLQVGLGVGMAMFGIVGGVTLLVGILALFGIVAPEVSAPEGFFILLALGAFIGLSMWSNKIIRRVEEEDQQATIAFIQRMFEAELIEPHLVSGAANVR